MPVYRCWNPEHGDEDDGRDVDAPAAGRAAMRFAEWFDASSADYSYATGGGTVCVRLSITYHAYMVDGGGS